MTPQSIVTPQSIAESPALTPIEDTAPCGHPQHLTVSQRKGRDVVQVVREYCLKCENERLREKLRNYRQHLRNTAKGAERAALKVDTMVRRLYAAHAKMAFLEAKLAGADSATCRELELKSLAESLDQWLNDEFDMTVEDIASVYACITLLRQGKPVPFGAVDTIIRERIPGEIWDAIVAQ